jgi:hypothetical protein
MTDDVRAAINGLRTHQLARVAQALYDPAPVADVEQFEANPPTVSELVRAVAEASGADPALLSAVRSEELVRRILLDMAQRDPHVREVIARAVAETMSGTTDAVLLIGVITYALAKLIRIEAENSGRHGRVRWRVRIGGDDAGIAAVVRDWVQRLGGGSGQAPPNTT